MKKAVIIYNSKTGVTRKYAEDIGKYFQSKSIEIQLLSIQEYKEGLVDKATYVLLGCWTSGLFVVLQHPQKEWIDFARKLPNMPNTKIALFTTYKFLTGSMFKNMSRQIADKYTYSPVEFKSRNGLLSGNDKSALDKFIAQV